MKNIFTDHPHRIGESYFEHCKFALLFGMNMLIGGLACLIHAFLPFLFEKTGSGFLIKMMHDLINRMPSVEKRIISLYELIQEKNRTYIEKID